MNSSPSDQVLSQTVTRAKCVASLRFHMSEKSAERVADQTMALLPQLHEALAKPLRLLLPRIDETKLCEISAAAWSVGLSMMFNALYAATSERER